MSNGKAMIIHIIALLIKRTLHKLSQYFLEPYSHFRRNVKVELNLSNYATKFELKEATRIDTSELAAKADLACLKAEVDKLDIDKLNIALVVLSKLSNVVNNEVVKKICVWQKVAKVNNIGTRGFVLKIRYDTDKSELEKKISDTSGLVIKTD